MRGDRICVVDRTHYNYCTCKGGDPNETWRYLYCSENCRNIYRIIDDYVSNKIDAKTAKERFNLLEMPEMDQLQDTIKKTVEDINSKAITVFEEKNEETIEAQEIVPVKKQKKRKNYGRKISEIQPRNEQDV